MPYTNAGLSVVILGGRIFAVGGALNSGGPGISTVYEYGTGLDTGFSAQAEGNLVSTWGSNQIANTDREGR